MVHHLLGQAVERMAAARCLEHDHAQRPPVGFLVQHAGQHLRRRVAGGAGSAGEMLRRRRERGDAEVGQRQLQRRARADQHILGLEIAMQDPVRVDADQRVGDLAHHAGDVVLGQRAGAQQVLERAARDVFEQLVGGAVRGAVREHPHDRVADVPGQDFQQTEIRRDAAAIELGHAAFATVHVGDEQDVRLAAGGREHIDDPVLLAQRGGQRPRAGQHGGGGHGAGRRPQRPVAVDAAFASRRIFLAAVGVRTAQRRGRGGGRCSIRGIALVRLARHRRERRVQVGVGSGDSRAGVVLGDTGAGGFAARRLDRRRRGPEREVHPREQRAAAAARLLGRILLPADRAQANVLAGHPSDSTCARTLS